MSKPLDGATVVLSPVADAELRAGAPGLVINGDTFVAGGLGDFAANETRRAVLRFDPGAIPTNAVIREVALTLDVVRMPQNAAPSTFELRRLLAAWKESEVSWTVRSTGAGWQVPGALGEQDASAVTSATAGADGLGEVAFQASLELRADVERWLRDPGLNHGWLLRSQGETTLRTARHFASRESAVVESRPRLMVTYTVPPVLVEVGFDQGDLVFRFQAGAGEIYRLEQRASLSEGAWSELRVLGPFSEATTVTVREPVPAGAPGHFFQVRAD